MMDAEDVNIKERILLCTTSVPKIMSFYEF
jgi:hypothetical protein